FIKPFLHQPMSQSAVQKPSLKLQTASNADFSRRYRFSNDSERGCTPNTSAFGDPTILCNWMFPDGGWGPFWTPQVNRLLVVRVSSAIASRKNQYISFKPTEETAAVFYRRARFPGVLGEIDCTLNPIPNPGGENGELFRNRKGYCSIKVQDVCDDKCQLTNIVARWSGSTHDSRIFDNSRLCSMLERGAYEGHLLGDNGYACCGYLMTPLLNPQTLEKREYNTSYILARGLIERVFGLWKKIFPCLKDGLCTKMDATLTIIITVADMYNLGKRQGNKLPEEAEEDLPGENAEDDQVQHAANAYGNAVRRTLIENHFTMRHRKNQSSHENACCVRMVWPTKRI
uniref:DDE Tnp4 domain-containing protein n=1 Tax=Salmo trutta TaxID=8032 RepID=A0A673WDJ8_SALTR